MAQRLDEARRQVADDHFEAYDFGAYEAEDTAGWESFSGRGPGEYTRVVYVLPPREDGSRPDPESDDTVVLHFTVSFPADSAIPTEITARIDGEDIGTPGKVQLPTDVQLDDEDVITPVIALKAILARIDGRFDDPALMRYGALLPDRMEDIQRFARIGLGQASL